MNPTTVKEFFQLLPGRLDSDAAEDLDAVYQFDLSGAQGGQYILTIREGACQVAEGMHADPHVVLSMAGEDCIKILKGQLSGPAVAMSGRLKISGDIGLAMQLKALFLQRSSGEPSQLPLEAESDEVKVRTNLDCRRMPDVMLPPIRPSRFSPHA